MLQWHFKCLKGCPPPHSLITQFNWNYGAHQKYYSKVTWK